MLKKINRINKTREFENIFKDGRKVYSKILGVKAKKNEFDYSRFGFIVSTKVSKKAVERNKIKRRLRAAINKLFSNIEEGVDVIVIALPSIINEDYEKIEAGLRRSLKKLRILKNEA